MSHRSNQETVEKQAILYPDISEYEKAIHLSKKLSKSKTTDLFQPNKHVFTFLESEMEFKG